MIKDSLQDRVKKKKKKGPEKRGKAWRAGGEDAPAVHSCKNSKKLKSDGW